LKSLLIATSDVEEIVKATVMDSLHVVRDGDKKLPLLRIHRRLAPIKMAVCIEGQQNKKCEQLSFELCHMIRRMDISCSQLQYVSKHDFHQLDEYGVYLVLIVDDDTMENGLIKMRMRDTSIKSPMHVSEVQNYLYQVFK